MEKVLTLRREKIDPNKVLVVVIKKSERLMLCAYVNDFVIDGYFVVNRSDITSLTQTKPDVYYTMILGKEGILPLTKKNIPKIGVDNWRNAVAGLIGSVIAVENEREGDYWFGPVISHDSSSLVIRHYDGCGIRKTDKVMPFEEITRLNIGDRYINTFKKYLKD